MVRPDLADLEPYVVKDVPHRIKLDANENPFDMPEQIRELIAQEAFRHPFNRYPDPAALALRESLSVGLNVRVDQLAVGNGSDELISYIIAAFGGTGARVIFPSPTFSIYGIFAKVWGTDVVDVPLASDFRISPDEIISAAKAEGRSIIFICYPNNPTGNCFSHEAILDIIKQHQGTSLMASIHHKATENAKKETVDESAFRYPGPKPQTREAGIVMLADLVEASSRSVHEKAPGSLKSLINTIIQMRFREGELDERQYYHEELVEHFLFNETDREFIAQFRRDATRLMVFD